MAITSGFLIGLIVFALVLSVLVVVSCIILSDVSNPSREAGFMVALASFVVFIGGSVVMYHFGQEDGVQAYMNKELVVDTVGVNPNTHRIVDIQIHNNEVNFNKQ